MPVIKCIGVAIYGHLFIEMWVNLIKVQISPTTNASVGSLLMIVNARSLCQCTYQLPNSSRASPTQPHITLLTLLNPEEFVYYSFQRATAII